MIQGWPWYALHFRENGLKWFFFLQNCTASSFSICNWKHLVIRSVFIPIPKKGNDKEYSSCCTIALISHTSKIMLKILQVHMNCELPNVQEGFKKMQRNQRSNCQHPLDHWKSKRILEKHLLLPYWLHQSLWLHGSQETGKFFKRWEYYTMLPASWEICMQVKKQQIELDMKQWTGSKVRKEYFKAVYCYPAYLTYM